MGWKAIAKLTYITQATIQKLTLSEVQTKCCCAITGSSITVFLFSGAYHSHFTESIGSVFALFNGKVYHLLIYVLKNGLGLIIIVHSICPPTLLVPSNHAALHVNLTLSLLPSKAFFEN